jgi:pseudouridine-5'-phosphate glycosidase
MGISPLVRTLVALTVGCVALTVTPVAASAAPAAVQAPAKHKMKVQAKPAKDQVKKHEKTQIKGRIDDSARSGATTVEALVVQELRAGIWVDVATGGCRPNGAFSIDISFDVSATLSLRVFHPETTLYASAVSDVFALVVL